jgi:excisionase family DNA binding protein
MSDPAKNNPFEPFFEKIREIVREEITSALTNGADHPVEKDVWLTPEQAAEILHVDKTWLYWHARRLPFTRKLSRKNIRFNEAGLKRWMASRK